LRIAEEVVELKFKLKESQLEPTFSPIGRHFQLPFSVPLSN